MTTRDRTLDEARVIAISGPVGAGKSTLARALADQFGGLIVSTHALMDAAARERSIQLEQERKALQDFGDRLDQETDETWVAAGVTAAIEGADGAPSIIIIDAVRTSGQILALRDCLQNPIHHIHVRAPNEVLAARYAERDSIGLVELADYDQVHENETERRVGELADDAEVAIDTARSTERDVVARAVAALGLYPPLNERLVDVVVGGQYGSEGKGNVAFHLAHEYDVLMRVGGPNAGHKVPTSPVYTHRLLPSGTMANPNADLIIGPGATIDVELLLQEIEHCGVSGGRLTVDPRAMVIEPADVDDERSLVSSIASTGKGGGAAAARRIMGRGGTESTRRVRLARDVEELAPYIRPSDEKLQDAFRSGRRVMLEGTQGTLLSLFHGLYPWVTSRDTTTAACLSEAGIGPQRVRKVIMVVRTYPIRVGSPPEGTSGSMSQEIGWETIASRAGRDEAELRELERGSVSSTQRRVAEFDWHQLRRASELNGVTDIALTFADYLDDSNPNARRFDQLSAKSIQFIEEVARVGGAPVSLISTGFDDRPLIDRRDW